MIGRAAIVFVLLAATAVASSGARSPEASVARESLERLPQTIGPWHGTDVAPFSDDVIAQLGVDDYVNRRYVGEAGVPVSVYVGYYASQRQGDTIHSPQNCLPGAGWQPIESGVQRVGGPDAAVDVNRYVIAKGANRQVVLYWYQGRGRIVTMSRNANVFC